MGFPPAEDRGHLMLGSPCYLISSWTFSTQNPWPPNDLFIPVGTEMSSLPVFSCYFSIWSFHTFHSESSICLTAPAWKKAIRLLRNQPFLGWKCSQMGQYTVYFLFFLKCQQLSHSSCCLIHGFSDKAGSTPALHLQHASASLPGSLLSCTWARMELVN